MFSSTETSSTHQAKLRSRVKEKRESHKALQLEIERNTKLAADATREHAEAAHKCGVARARFRDTLKLIRNSNLRSTVELNGVSTSFLSGEKEKWIQESALYDELCQIDEEIQKQTRLIVESIKKTRELNAKVEEAQKKLRSTQLEIASTVNYYNILFGSM